MGLNPQWYEVAKAKGLIDDRQAGTTGPPATEPPKLVPMVCLPRSDTKGRIVELTWALPIVTASEANGRDWKARSNRTKQARDIISKAFGPVELDRFKWRYHALKLPLDVTFTRLGGRKLDAANLPVALKSTEDAVAMMLGCDDGDPRWRVSFEQEPGGLTGVRVTIRMGEIRES